ncbi:MAG: hydrogenase formation protein HypD [archaeon]|nr:hydrogenase formation protein HypD [archaeon]
MKVMADNVLAGETGSILEKIRRVSQRIGKDVSIMEVCGTHTQTIARYGIKSLLPENVKIVSGPGCPVCVTPQKIVDISVRLALEGKPVATYGDMLKVPGTEMSLEGARSEGADVFVVESTVDALRMKKDYKDIIFLAIGFETTTPMTAYAVKKGLDIICAHKTIPEAMVAIADDSDNKIDGFLNPGHVSAITGVDAYECVKAPQVISGFEPEDVLVSVFMLLSQIENGLALVENQYGRVVKKEGNPVALELTDSVFKKCDAEWRGLGIIAQSGLILNKKYMKYDAEKKYADILDNLPVPKMNPECRCAEVIMGKIEPCECPLFSRLCNPDMPVGPCMVGSESSCRIAYKYREAV